MEDEYLSDLTDVDEDEVQQSLSPSKKGRSKVAKTDVSGYKIQGALNAPRATTYNAQHIFDQLEAGDINLDAEYQRDVVWPTAKQIGLIDSVFRNFYIPPVIFSVTYQDDGSEKRVCIDGKQRLTSIQKFMNGIIPHRDVFTGDKFFYKENSDRTERGKLLPTPYKKIFSNKQIVCIEYTQLSDGSEREIFQRVQLGMALTPAERLQAVSSPASKFVRTLLALYIHNQLGKKNKKNKNEFLEWDTSRGGDFRCVASAVHCIDKDLKTVPAMSSLTKWLQQPDEIDEQVCEDLHDTFKIFIELAKRKSWRACFDIYDKNKLLKVSPAEFIMTVVLIYRFKGKFTMQQLADAIERMRLDIREVETDIRMNTRCFKHMLGFIQKLKVSQFTPDPNHNVAAIRIKSLYNDPRSQEQDEESDSDEDIDELDETPAPKGKATATPKRKRARDASDDEADADYHPRKQSAAPQRSPRVPKHEPTSPPSEPSISTAPPPYSTQPPAVHPDRLAAIRQAKTYEQASAPPEPAYSPRPPLNTTGWPNLGATLASGFGGDVGRAIMDRMAYSQQPYAPPPSMPYPQDPYPNQRGYAPPPPIPRMTGPNQYAMGDNGYQRRGGASQYQ